MPIDKSDSVIVDELCELLNRGMVSSSLYEVLSQVRSRDEGGDFINLVHLKKWRNRQQIASLDAIISTTETQES